MIAAELQGINQADPEIIVMKGSVDDAESTGTGSLDGGLNLTNQIVTVLDSNALIKLSEISQCEGEKQPLMEKIGENDGIDIEAEHTLFKVPLK